MISRLSSLLLVVLVAMLVGCSSKGGVQGGAAVEDRSMGADGGAATSGAAGTSSFSSYSLNDPNSPLARRVIYFDYDSAEITAADQDTLLAHASYLAANPNQISRWKEIPTSAVRASTTSRSATAVHCRCNACLS